MAAKEEESSVLLARSIAAEARIRETAKWLTVSLAVIGGVITAGVQFSNIGDLEWGSERFWWMVLGGLLAALGTAGVLYGAAHTAVTPFPTLSKVDAGQADAAYKAELEDPFLIEGIKNLNTFREIYRGSLKERRRRLDDYLANPGDATKTAAEAAATKARILSDVAQKVLARASYLDVSRRWKKSLIFIGISAVVGAAGLLAFIWGINPPKANETRAAPAVVGEAGQGEIVLTDTGRQLLSGRLGEGCPVAEPLEVMVLGSVSSGQDVLVMQPGCAALRLLITPEWGAQMDAATPSPAPSPAG